MFRSVLAALLLVVICFADSGVMFEFPDGRTVAMISNGKVAMAAESVFIEPSLGNFNGYDEKGWLRNMSIRCMFELVNLTDEEQFITVGFPFDANFGNSYSTFDDEMLAEELNRSFADEYRPPWESFSLLAGMNAEEDIPTQLDFRTQINGEEEEVYFRKCAISLDENMLWRPVVAVWKMEFEPNETVILENTYNTSWDYVGGGPWYSTSMKYILTSGGTWSGPIGDAVIILTVPEEIPEPCLNDTMLAYWQWDGTPVIDGRTITWHYTDFEPDENISFSAEEGIQLGFWENSINPERMYNTISWTEEDLLGSTALYLKGDFVWRMQADTRLTLRIVEGLPWLIQGVQPPNGIEMNGFSVPESGNEPVFTSEMNERLNLVHDLQQQMEINTSVADDAGYLEFLPLFVSRFSWTEEALDMYAGMPEKEEKYLDLVEHLERAAAGEYIENGAVRSFYMLTGWYSYGRESVITPLPEVSVTAYRELGDLERAQADCNEALENDS